MEPFADADRPFGTGIVEPVDRIVERDMAGRREHEARGAVTSASAQSLYIASPEAVTGKSLVALGVVNLLKRRVRKVGVFRPVTRSSGDDHVLDLLVDGEQGVPADACCGVTYDEVHADAEAALATIMDRYRTLARQCDVVVIIGTDFTDVATPTELEFNARIAVNLGAPVLLVVSGHGRTPADVAHVVDMATNELTQMHVTIVGTVVNRCDPDNVESVRKELGESGLSAWTLPEIPLLAAPLVADVKAALDAQLLYGDAALLEREAEQMLVCGMNVEHILERLRDGQLCIAAGDRPAVLVALAAAHAAAGFPNLAGVVLNGGYAPSDLVAQLVRGLDEHLPVLLTEHNSYDAARIVASTRGLLGDTQRKIDTALGAFEEHVDAESLLRALDVHRTDVVTPLMFEAMLLERARADRRRIVLPEGDEERILRASSTLLSRQVVDLVLLGNPAQIAAKASSLGVDIDAAQIVDPRASDLTEPFAVEYTKLRAHRGMTLERARDIVRDVSYFGTMMVHMGHADGMVSGVAHSTAHTITPSFEIIKTVPNTTIASSVFFMCLEDRVLVYGDCAVIPDPSVEELADIAISAAETASQFGIEPRIAMLSYSTGASGSGDDVEKVRFATELAKSRRPDLLIDGPLQYDAAVDASVAKTKLPDSDVAGRATVFVFPDLNTGNNTYKAVQRSAGAVAIGPILQGLNKPVNDLSRGATVRDIVNTIAITAIQAQAASGEKHA